MNARAELRQVRPGGGNLWWTTFLETHASDVNRRFTEAGAVYWQPAQAVSVDLFSYVREAALCYSVGRYLATISLSGALIETIINRDSRMSMRPHVRRIDGWATLNNRNLREAESAGLPVRVLLKQGENLTDKSPIDFVRHRNKIAHGDLADHPAGLTDYSPVYEEMARDQLTKATNFLIEWFNSSPDIQTQDYPETAE